MRKRRNIIIAVLAVLCAGCFLLCGCELGPTAEKIRRANNLTAQVTYYGNGGKINNLTEKTLEFSAGALAPDLGETALISGSIQVTREDFALVGWYYAEVDAFGNPVFLDEEKTLLRTSESDVKVDFSVPLSENEHRYIYAKWDYLQKLEIRFVSDDKSSLNAEDITYNVGDVIAEQSFGTTGRISRPSSDPLSGVANEFFTCAKEYYYDEDCTQVVSWPVVRDESVEGNIAVYLRYIPGANWKLIKTKSDFLGANFGIPSNKYYLFNDVDFEGGSFKQTAVFSCVFAGNGFTVKNGVCTVSENSASAWSNKTVSVFGDIKETAQITDVNFENITFNVATGKVDTPKVYLFATALSENAQFSGVTFTGTLNLTVSKPEETLTENIQPNEEGDGYITCNYLIGGLSDEQARAIDGLTITATLSDSRLQA